MMLKLSVPGGLQEKVETVKEKGMTSIHTEGGKRKMDIQSPTALMVSDPSFCAFVHRVAFEEVSVRLFATPCHPTLCHYTVNGILQARILEWIAFPFSRDLPNPGIEPGSPALRADSLSTELSGTLLFFTGLTHTC